MSKRIVLSMVMMMATQAMAGNGQVGSVGANNNSMAKAVGQYKLAEGSCSKEEYVSSTYRVEFRGKKRAALGSECGAVLWVSSPEDPMGVFFCRADSAVSDKTIAVQLDPKTGDGLINFNLVNAGKTSNESLQFEALAKNNHPALFDGPENKSYKMVFTVTKKGFDLEESGVYKNGKIESRTCSYVRSSK